MGASRGQGTVEYLAMLLVVGALLVTGGVAVAAPGVANAVGRAFRHALCRVVGSGCATVDPSACVVRATTWKGSVTARLTILKVGRSSAILRAERSDGTVDVTLLDDLGGGVQATLGGRARIALGSAALNAGAVGEAELTATLGGGRTWRVHGDGEADRLVHRLAVVLAARGGSALPVVGHVLDLGERVLHVGAHARLPEPDSTTVTGGLEGEVKALLGPVPGAKGRLAGVIGRRRDRDGTTTWLLRIEGEAGMPLLRAIGLRAAGGGDVSVALTLDPQGHPRLLTVGGSGVLAESSPLTGSSGTRGAGGRLRGSAALDLGVPGDRALAEAVLHAMAPGRVAQLPGAVGALAAAIADRGALDVTAYREQRRAYGGELSAGVGAGAGVSAELSRTGAALAAAWTRPPGGAWEQRLDCVG